jgi:hypothetical protein
VIVAFDQTIMQFPSIKRSPGGASTGLVPNLQHPEDPLPILKNMTNPHGAMGGGA